MTRPEQRIAGSVERLSKPLRPPTEYMQSPDAIELILDCRDALKEIRDGKWRWRPRETGTYARRGPQRRPWNLPNYMVDPSQMELIDDLRDAVHQLKVDSVKRGDVINLTKCHCESRHRRWWRWWK